MPGRHFTPRDIVELIADLAFVPIEDQIKSTTYRIYDGACGTRRYADGCGRAHSEAFPKGR